MMSNYLSVATVTATLGRFLQSELDVDVPGAKVFSTRPDGGSGSPPTGVNIYLYQVSPNAAWRNADLPTRNTNGKLVDVPKIPLDLYYLLTFTGDEGQLEPQRVLGSVVRSLHERPIITRQMIRDTQADPNYSYLSTSDLANEIETIKFTPMSLSLEDLSKLWSVFFQTTYNLSIAYRASVIFLDGRGSPQLALPVQAFDFDVDPALLPVVETKTPDKFDNLQLWFKSDAGVTYDANGASLWQDQSGNGNHAIQNTASSRPSFLAHGIAGKPVVRFDGNDDYMAIQNLQYNTAGGINGITVFALVRSQSSAPQIIASFDRDEYWHLAIKDAADQNAGWDTTDSGNHLDNLRSPAGHLDGHWHLIYGRFEAGGGAPDKLLYIDGQVAAQINAHGGNALGTGATRFGFVGVGSKAAAFNGTRGPLNFFAGDLAELLIYHRALSDEERQQIEQYFLNKYS